MSARVLVGDCRDLLATLDAGSVQTCVTSPPYFGLRDYGVAGQLGLEATPDAYVAALVAVCREVRRVLRDDGTLWLNLGDSYSGSGKGGNPDPGSSKQATNAGNQTVGVLYGKTGETARMAAVTNVSRRLLAAAGIQPKQLLGIPWRVAFALQADGWYLRSDIIWAKPNPMPESVTDRPTKSHEYLFLLAKQERYYYDADAIAEPVTASTVERLSQPTLGQQEGSDRVPGKTNGRMKAVGGRMRGRPNGAETFEKFGHNTSCGTPEHGYRNRRTVWTIATQPFSGAHFATFPPALIEPCILAGSARQACETCGAAWGRTTEYGRVLSTGGSDKGARASNMAAVSPLGQDATKGAYNTGNMVQREKITTGFAPRCDCETNTGSGRSLVLDPFGGAGTTGLVADRLGRDSILCELNPAYAEMARRRITDDAPLFAEGVA